MPASLIDWFLDSTVTHYVDLNNQSTFASHNGTDQLQTGNGMGMHIQHIGSSTFSLPNHSITISNILYVPMFTKNLLSFSQLLYDNDLTIEFF